MGPTITWFYEDNVHFKTDKQTFFQVMTGVGTPTAPQLRYTWEPVTLYTSPGGVTMSGAAAIDTALVWSLNGKCDADHRLTGASDRMKQVRH